MNLSPVVDLLSAFQSDANEMSHVQKRSSIIPSYEQLDEFKYAGWSDDRAILPLDLEEQEILQIHDND